MQTTIRKWGNSLAVRIPKALASESRVSAGTEVDLSVADGVITIAIRPPPKPNLDDLLKAVTEQNRHAAIKTGRPVGQEVW